MAKVAAPTPEERAEMVRGLSEQLNVTHQQISACHRHNMALRGKEPVFKTTLHGLTLAHGVGRWGARLPHGINKLTDKLCYSHATHLMMADERYVYCEGYACSRRVGLAVNHAWVLDAARGYVVVDNTWRDPVGGVYLGIPFKRDFARRSVALNRMYGVMDNWKAGFPVLTLPPEEFLYEGRHYLPRDFEAGFDPDAENMFERLRLLGE